MPILIHFKNNFIIITSKEENGFIAVEDNGNKIHLKQMDLLTNWKGYAIKAYPSITSIEYNYSHHIKYHNKKRIFISIFLLAMILSLLFIIYINFNIYTKISVAIIMANLCATCAAFMSLLNYLSIPNVSTKLCNAIKFSNCNLGNTMIANKLFLNYLPALSVSYFSINLLLLLSFPLLTSCIFIVVIMASIMCVVSIIYQIYIRKLCILCCIIVLSIVCMDIISWPVFEFRPRTDIIAILLMLMAYFSGFILINYYVRNNRLEQTLSSSELEYNELKFSDVLLDAYFGGNPTSYINVNNSSTLVFGNVKAINELIIVSNPLCEACSIIHPYITHLINSRNYTVRYFFKDFDKSVSKINKYLISTYFELGSECCLNMMSKWFSEDGRKKYIIFNLIDKGFSERVCSEYEKQSKWIEDNKINQTPTIFLNGIKIENPYTIYDIPYLAKYHAR